MSVSLFCRGLGLGLGFIAAACTPTSGKPDESSSEADSDACSPGALNCVCEANHCDPGLVCASGYCVDAGVATDSSDTVVTSSATTSTTGTESGTTGSSGDSMTTEAQQCDDATGASDQCPNGAPYCVEGSCVDCSALASCAEVDADAPACDGASGLCVECTDVDASACSGGTPVCDAALQTCVKCAQHDECSSGACDILSGACFPDADTLWVDRKASCSGEGTEASPFCEIQDAVKAISPGAPTIVRVVAGVTPYTTKIDVGSGVIAALIGEGGSPAIDVDLDAMLVNDGARVYLNALRFVGSSMNAGNGLVCIGAEVWTDRVDLSSREAVAIDAFDCTLRLRRSRVYANLGGGIKVNGGSTTIENTFVTSNGTGFAQYGGVYVSNTAELSVVYSTIVDNNADANADSIHCVGSNTVALRNSMLFGQTAASSVICDDAIASDSVVDSMFLAGGRNVVIEPFAQSSWFKDAGGGDFHVKDGAPFADLARWRVGDPGVDYDGDARPAVELASDWAGADRLP